MSIKVLFTGGKEMSARLRAAAAATPEVAGRALFEAGEDIMGVAKERTPVDTGALRSSGHVQPPKFTGSNVSVLLAYGGPSAPYAIPVHEDLSAHHNVGQAKFLESALLEMSPDVPAKVGAALVASLRKR